MNEPVIKSTSTIPPPTSLERSLRISHLSPPGSSRSNGPQRHLPSDIAGIGEGSARDVTATTSFTPPLEVWEGKAMPSVSLSTPSFSPLQKTLSPVPPLDTKKILPLPRRPSLPSPPIKEKDVPWMLFPSPLRRASGAASLGMERVMEGPMRSSKLARSVPPPPASLSSLKTSSTKKVSYVQAAFFSPEKVKKERSEQPVREAVVGERGEVVRATPRSQEGGSARDGPLLPAPPRTAHEKERHASEDPSLWKSTRSPSEGPSSRKVTSPHLPKFASPSLERHALSRQGSSNLSVISQLGEEKPRSCRTEADMLPYSLPSPQLESATVSDTLLLLASSGHPRPSHFTALQTARQAYHEMEADHSQLWEDWKALKHTTKRIQQVTLFSLLPAVREVKAEWEWLQSSVRYALRRFQEYSRTSNFMIHLALQRYVEGEDEGEEGSEVDEGGEPNERSEGRRTAESGWRGMFSPRYAGEAWWGGHQQGDALRSTLPSKGRPTFPRWMLAPSSAPSTAEAVDSVQEEGKRLDSVWNGTVPVCPLSSSSCGSTTPPLVSSVWCSSTLPFVGHSRPLDALLLEQEEEDTATKDRTSSPNATSAPIQDPLNALPSTAQKANNDEGGPPRKGSEVEGEEEEVHSLPSVSITSAPTIASTHVETGSSAGSEVENKATAPATHENEETGPFPSSLETWTREHGLDTKEDETLWKSALPCTSSTPLPTAPLFSASLTRPDPEQKSIAALLEERTLETKGEASSGCTFHDLRPPNTPFPLSFPFTSSSTARSSSSSSGRVGVELECRPQRNDPVPVSEENATETGEHESTEKTRRTKQHQRKGKLNPEAETTEEGKEEIAMPYLVLQDLLAETQRALVELSRKREYEKQLFQTRMQQIHRMYAIREQRMREEILWYQKRREKAATTREEERFSCLSGGGNKGGTEDPNTEEGSRASMVERGWEREKGEEQKMVAGEEDVAAASRVNGSREMDGKGRLPHQGGSRVHAPDMSATPPASRSTLPGRWCERTGNITECGGSVLDVRLPPSVPSALLSWQQRDAWWHQAVADTKREEAREGGLLWTPGAESRTTARPRSSPVLEQARRSTQETPPRGTSEGHRHRSTIRLLPRPDHYSDRCEKFFHRAAARLADQLCDSTRGHPANTRGLPMERREHHKKRGKVKREEEREEMKRCAEEYSSLPRRGYRATREACAPPTPQRRPSLHFPAKEVIKQGKKMTSVTTKPEWSSCMLTVEREKLQHRISQGMWAEQLLLERSQRRRKAI